jgi:hypothetical protein
VHLLLGEQTRQRDDLARQHLIDPVTRRVAQVKRPSLQVAVEQQIVTAAQIDELTRPDLDLFAQQPGAGVGRLTADLAHAGVFR